MKYTSNFKFKKPEPTDTVNVNDFNDSFDLVDTELKKQKDNNDNMLLNEDERVSAENERKSSESERILAEDIRKSNETTRISEHEAMITEANMMAETIQSLKDNAQETFDNMNIVVGAAQQEVSEAQDAITEANSTNMTIGQNEVHREYAENLRETQEATRKSNEDNRLIAEEERKSNELARIGGEQMRNGLEGQRQAAEAERVAEFDEIKAAYENATKENLSIEVSNARGSFNNLETRLDHNDSQLAELENELDVAVGAVTADSEVVLARNSTAKSKTFTTLDGRLEDLDSDTYLPLKNVVTNGDFSNGTTGWTSGAGGGLTVTDGIGVVTGDGINTNRYASQIFTTIPSHKYYVKNKIKRISGSGCVLTIYAGNGSPSTVDLSIIGVGVFDSLALGDWYSYSGVFTATQSYARYLIGRLSIATFVANIDDVIAIDLTETFGVGNEPTQAQMDSIMSFYSNSWFDGTINIAKNTKIVPYLLNNIRQLNLEKTSYGVYSGLAISAQATPDMTINVPTGVIYMPNGRRFTPSANATLAVNTADSTNSRIDVIYVDYVGTIRYLAGLASATPSAPTVPTDGQKLYEINVSAGATAITNTMLVDKRKFLNYDAKYVPTLVNSWTLSNASKPFRYHKVLDFLVRIAGEITGGVNGTTVMTFITGYRPITDQKLKGQGGYVTISTAGVMVAYYDSGSTSISLDGMMFSTV